MATGPPNIWQISRPIGEGRLSPPITTGTPNVFHLPASFYVMIGFVMTTNLSQLKIAQLQSKNKQTLRSGVLRKDRSVGANLAMFDLTLNWLSADLNLQNIARPTTENRFCP